MSTASAPATGTRHAQARWAVRAISTSLALLLVMLALPSLASAYWSATGSGAGGTITDTLAPPTGVSVPEISTSDVPVSWTASAGEPSPTGYYVTRSSGGAAQVACGTSPAALVPGTSCTDVGVAEDTYTYVVTAVSRSWSADSDPSGSVTVAMEESAPFAVLGRHAVSSTLATSVSGDLGVGPGGAISGFPPGVVAGTIHNGDAAAAAGLTAFDTAYLDAEARTATAEIAGDLAGRTLTPGVYHAGAALALTGVLTFSGGPDDTFVLQIDNAAALTTAAASTVAFSGGAQARNVTWQVGGAVSTGADSSFSGTVLAAGAITLGARSGLIGRALSNGTVTLSANTIRFSAGPPPTITLTPGSADTTKDTTPTLAGTTTAAVGRLVTVTVNGQRLRTTVQTGGAWSVTAAALPASTYEVVASVRDAAGNTGTATQQLTVEANPLAVALGSARTFSVLAATGVSSTGATAISGDVGSSPSDDVTVLAPGTVAGTTHAGDATAAAAQLDLVSAIADAGGRAPHTTFAGDPAGRTFHAGVHRAATALSTTGQITLDGEGQTDAVFIFQLDGALSTAASSTIVLTGGAQPANVFWVVTGAVTLGADSTFVGTVLGRAAVTVGARATLLGRAMSRGTVTLGANPVRFTQALPPTIAITSATTTKDTTPAITGTSSAAAGSAVTVVVDDQTLTTTVQSGGTWTVTAAVLTAGSYAVRAQARDAALNGAAVTQTLTVEVNPPTVPLGSASTYSVLAATDVTSTGDTRLAGDVGVGVGPAIVGFPPGIAYGETHDGDAAAQQAQADLGAAVTNAAGRVPHTQFAGDLVGRTFHAGVHHSDTAVALTGTVTLDGQGQTDAVFLFQVDAALTTAANSNVVLTGGARAENVFWVVTGAASTGADSAFAGTILGKQAVGLGARGALAGRALSRTTVGLSANPVTWSVP